MDDRRPDEFLRECGRVGYRLGLHFAWTDSLTGPGAKACSRNGSAAWKRAKPLPADEQQATALFATRARKRNPAVVLGSSGLVGIEADGDLAELRAKLGIPALPATVTVRSRRGVHLYYRPPAGRATMKVQLDPAGVIVAEDGYLVGAGAIHALGDHVYEYVNGDAIVALPPAIYDLLVELGGQTRAESRERFEAGEPIPQGRRNEAIFGLALELARAGQSRAEILERLLQVNKEQCRPPLDERELEKQLKGALAWARTHPTETDKARTRARRILDEQHGHAEAAAEGVDGVGRRQPRKAKARALFLPFTDVAIAGPVRWVWRGKIPESGVSLLAGRPKLGKSLLSVWLAAQLSRGKLEGAHFGQAARTLLIAAEDPVDTIVKARLIAAAADESFVGTLASRPSRPSTESWGLERDLDGQDRHEQRSTPQANLDGLDGLDGLGTVARRIVVPDEYELLEQIVVENEIALVVLDPINSFLSRSIDAHRDVEIRRVLDPLAALCARRHFAALAVVHLNRRTDSDVLNRITGSGGYSGSARSILTFGRHPENDEQRVVASEGNWQRENRSELFEIRELIVFPDADPEERTQPALVHLGTTNLDSSDLVDQLNDDRSALEQAKDYLLGELSVGPVAVTDLRRGAEAHGVSWPTVERAKRLLGVEARRISTPGSPRGAGRWEWFLELEEEPAG